MTIKKGLIILAVVIILLAIYQYRQSQKSMTQSVGALIIKNNMPSTTKYIILNTQQPTPSTQIVSGSIAKKSTGGKAPM